VTGPWPCCRGRLAGLSLLHDLPNYRHSRPTKIVEYMAHGVPVHHHPLPVAVELVESAGAGIVVPFDDPEAAAAAILALREDPAQARAYGAAGHAAARAAYDWNTAGPAVHGDAARPSQAATRPSRTSRSVAPHGW
jgi:glycosyltransferase involved in cell wall biosynthesis